MDKDKFKMPIACLLFGHKETEFTDSGFPYCKKCKCHSYWNNDEWTKAGLLLRPIWLVKERVKNLFRNELPF